MGMREEEKAKENKNDIYVPLKQRKLLDELKSTDFVYESSGSSYATPAQSVDNSDDENEESSKKDENTENPEINIENDPDNEKSEEKILTHEEKLIAEQKSIKKRVEDRKKEEEEQEKKKREKIEKVFGKGQKMSLFDENLIEQGIVAEENKNKHQ